MYYSGIGSRQTPQHIIDNMIITAEWLATEGYILRSGNANGADVAFGIGCDSVNGSSEIYLPYKNFNGGCRNSLHVSNKRILKQATQIMKTLKPKTYTWNAKNTPYHQRNVFQVLGVNLNTPSKFVICYTATGAESEHEILTMQDSSGTSTAIVLADRLGIPVINMFNANWLEKLEHIL